MAYSSGDKPIIKDFINERNAISAHVLTHHQGQQWAVNYKSGVALSTAPVMVVVDPMSIVGEGRKPER